MCIGNAFAVSDDKSTVFAAAQQQFLSSKSADARKMPRK